MDDMNWIVLLVAALIPTLTGFIWYNPRVMGTIWMREAGVTEDMMKNTNMIMVMVVSLVLSLMLALMLAQITIHQMHLGSLTAGDPTMSDPNSPHSVLLTIFTPNTRVLIARSNTVHFMVHWPDFSLRCRCLAPTPSLSAEVFAM